MSTLPGPTRAAILRDAPARRHPVVTDPRGLAARSVQKPPALPVYTKTYTRACAGRFVLVAATFRERDGKRFIRPISARYMHEKEVEAYERAQEAMAAAAKR